MSLDLFINLDKPVKHHGTGVFIREGGKNIELETIEEVKAHFPDIDLSNIKEVEYESDIVWHENITHNLGNMASHVPVYNSTLYYYLWHPSDIGIKYVNQYYKNAIKTGYEYIKDNREYLEKFNPPNGWGTYENLLRFVKSLDDFLQNLKIDHSKEYSIYADV